MTQTTTTTTTAVADTLEWAFDPRTGWVGKCEPCLSYLVDRLYVVLPHLVANARHVDPSAQPEDWLVADTAVSDELEAYADQVHARHLAGLSIAVDSPDGQLDDRPDWQKRFPTLPADLTSWGDPLPGPWTTRPHRPCSSCSNRGRKRKSRRTHDHQAGDFQ